MNQLPLLFLQMLCLEEKMVEAGTYSLYTIPGDNWTIIINDKLSWELSTMIVQT